MQIIDKYNKIIVEKLPSEITKELDEIKSTTNNFQDEELLKIFEENFNDLYTIIEKKYPEAIKPKIKLKPVEKEKLKEPEKKKAGTQPEDCEEAIEELQGIKAKKEKAAEKRAKTIKKKKRSEYIKERIQKVFISIKKADKENKFTEQIGKLEKFHMTTAAHLLRYIRNNDEKSIDKLLKLAVEETKI